MNRLVRFKRYSLTVLAALPAAMLWTADFIACSIKAAFCILLVLLVPAPMSMASLVGNMRVKSPASSTTGNNSSSSSVSGGSSTDSTASALAERQSLVRTTQTIAAVRAAQAAARAAAKSSASSVPNGLTSGGLVVASGATPGTDLWQGAAAPTQSVQNGRTVVDIQQQTAKAILTWETFNVGRETTVNFDQGGRDWVALNRVTDPSASPSQILGQINAPGSVYIINRNGIIFGGASQVNVHNLVAAAANISNSQFLNSGIYSTQVGSTYAPAFTDAFGNVIVEAGAEITTAVPSSVTSGGGFVLLLGSEVDNHGMITTPKGQTELAAGDDFILRPGYSTTSNSYSTTRGNEIAPIFDVNSSAGSVTNTGFITAAQGDITLAGRTVTQDGVLIASTSVNQRGTIHLLNSATNADGSITLTGNSLTAILPELDSDTTALDSQRDALIADSATQNTARANAAFGQFDNLSKLDDREDQSRVEIATGGSVVFKGGSETQAQGGQIAVSAAGRIITESGADLDVSGVSGVSLAMSINNIMVNIQGNELRDSPLNRDSKALKSNNVWINISDLVYVPAGTGGYTSDRYYTSGGLLEVGGYLSNLGHTIGEWTAVGGNIMLSANEVVAQAGSSFNISGGSVDYASGVIKSTRLLGSDGRYYSIEDAPSYLTYIIANNVFNVDHAKWNVTESYYSPLTDRSTIYTSVDGYTVGRDAGRLILNTSKGNFYGSITAGVVNGSSQTGARSSGVTDGYKLPGGTVALPGSLTVHNNDYSAGTKHPVTGDVTISPVKPADTAEIWLDETALNSAGLGGLQVAATGAVTVAGDLALAPGGSLSLYGGTVTVNGDITARGGSVALGQNTDGFVTNIAVTVAENVTIDTRGLWSNALTDPATEWMQAFADGGDVTIRSTGDVTLGSGSLINASAGGFVSEKGATIGGAGGDITLIASYTMNSKAPGNHGDLTLGGTLLSYGFTKGGKLTLETGGVLSVGEDVASIGDTLTAGTAAPYALTLSEDTVIPEGTVLPIAATLKLDTLPAGGTLPVGYWSFVLYGVRDYKDFDGDRNTSEYLVTHAAWTNIPVQTSIITSAGNSVTIGKGGTIPAGSQITGFDSSFTNTAVTFPANVFPQGVPIMHGGGFAETYWTVPVSLAAGSIATADVTLAAGTVLAKGTVVARDVAVIPIQSTTLPTSLFQSGFSSYSVNGQSGLIVPDGVAINGVMPAYCFTDAAYGASTGSDIADVAKLWTPTLYQENAKTATLTRRAGASIALLSGIGADGTDYGCTQGFLTIGKGASITVDDGQSVRIASSGQVTVNGAITARGGTIDIVNTYTQEHYVDPGALSVWIGGDAVLDASARAYIATDSLGRLYGVVPDGGTINIGSTGGSFTAIGDGGPYKPGIEASTHAYVIIRPGAVLDASGASGELDVVGAGLSSRRVTVASDGGTIALRSWSGIRAEGTLRALAGGAGASGGTLIVNLESPLQANYDYFTIPTALGVGRVLTVSQEVTDALSADVEPGESDANLILGQGGIAVSQIKSGGFDSVSLLGRTALLFDGDVSLGVARSLSLKAGTYASVSGGSVLLSAAYMLLAGQDKLNFNYAKVPETLSTTYTADGTLSVSANLIDVSGTIIAPFADIGLASSGDLRFIASDTVSSPIFYAAHDLTLSAARIYPASGVTATVEAGYTQGFYSSGNGGNAAPSPSLTDIAAVLSITRPNPSASVETPYSAFGSLTLAASSILQGGALFAPFGTLNLSALTTDFGYGTSSTDALVKLLAGSITSVSGKGLVMPYGGTTDDETWTVNGASAGTINLVSAQYNTSNGTTGSPTGINLQGTGIIAEAGATVDLSGGGTLTGAAFVSGRGGSVDTLLYPLHSGGAVYALVPGVVTAPAAGGYYTAWTGATPGIGQTITIPAGVPGLPAGTYTLMPANYALLPGAYRVELGATSTTAVRGVATLSNGSYLLSGYQGVANTSIHDALPTSITITPAATVRTYSHYNETGYASFLVAQAATVGALRPMIEADAKHLSLIFGSTSTGHAAFSWDAMTEMNGNGNSAYDGVLSITTAYIGSNAYQSIAIVADDDNTTRSSARVVLRASDIDAFGAASLFIGGRPMTDTTNPSDTSYIVLGDPASRASVAQSVTLGSGAVLTAGQVVLSVIQGGAIRLDPGSLIDTRAYDSAARLLDASTGTYLGGGTPLLVVSNGNVTLNTTIAQNATGAISIGDGAALYADGTIGFLSKTGATFDGTPLLGAKTLDLTVDSINIGTADALAAAEAAGTLAVGLNLTQDLFASLVAGDVARDIPGVSSLHLGAGNSVNLYGSANLDLTALGSLVLTTPAIYGAGAAGDAIRIEVGDFTWNVARRLDSTSGYASALPGAITTGGAGTGLGSLTIAADTITLGHPARLTGGSTVTFNHLLLGFSGVTLSASERITSVGNVSLSAWQRGPDPSASFDPATYAGIGGSLTLLTPLLTANAGSVASYHAGGSLTVALPAGATAADTGAETALGGRINLVSSGGAITLDTAVALPSGTLTATAAGDIVLGVNSRLDLSARTVLMEDKTEYSWGGAVALESTYGDITQQQGSVIDVSASNNDAGSITLTSTGDAHGHVILGGILKGAGGSGSKGGSIDLRAQVLGRDPASLSANFAALNAALTTGGFTESRGFDIKQGDLVIGDGLKAHSVSVSIDGGSLTVNGTIDASGKAPGSISLAAHNNLTIASSAVLDVHGTVLQVDSYGAAVEAKNRGTIDLSTSQPGWLILEGGAKLDLGSPDGVARGEVDLNAWRVSETGGDVKISAPDPVTILGAKSVSVHGFWSYSPTDADGTVVQNNGGSAPVALDGSVGLNQIDTRSQLFIKNALANPSLQARLKGLTGAELLPGVDIVAQVVKQDASRLISANTTTLPDWLNASYIGKTVKFTATGSMPWYWEIYGGDGTYPLFTVYDRDGNLVSNTIVDVGYQLPGSVSDLIVGQQYTLVVTKEMVSDVRVLKRALKEFFPDGLYLGTPVTSGNLTVKGDIDLSGYRYGPDADRNTSSATYGAGGAMKLVMRAAGDLTIGGSISDGFKGRPGVPGTPNTYDGITTASDSSTGYYLNDFGYANQTYASDGGAYYYFAQDWVIPNTAFYRDNGAQTSRRFYSVGQTIPAGTKFSTYDMYFDSGAPLPAFATTVTLGTPAIPAISGVSAAAAMQAPGTQSASIRLVAGADVAAASSRILLAASTLGDSGNLVLNNTQSGATDSNGIPVPSVLRTGVGALDLAAGGDFIEKTLYGVYTAGTDTDARGIASGTYMPDHGGDLTLIAQGDVTGYTYTDTDDGVRFYSPDNWLLRSVDADGLASWSIRFGASVTSKGISYLTGFTGIGTLGGGNVTVSAGGNAGAMTSTFSGNGSSQTYGSLQVTVASSGKVTSVTTDGDNVTGGTLVQTGGGDLTVTVRGTLNSGDNSTPQNAQAAEGSPSIFTDLRGNIEITAGAIGAVSYVYGLKETNDPRALDAATATVAMAAGGIALVPGDGSVTVRTAGDLVVSAYADAGQIGTTTSSTAYFSLWRPEATSVSLFSAGGNLVPVTDSGLGNAIWKRSGFSGTLIVVPGLFSAVAAEGSIYLGGPFAHTLELAPSANGSLELLAGQSIYGAGLIAGSATNTASLRIDVSGAGTGVNDIPNPFKPVTVASNSSYYNFASFQNDTVSDNLHEGDTDPIRIYAVNGDIVNVALGEIAGVYTDSLSTTLYIASEAARVIAGGDIVNFGAGSAGTTAGLILNANANDVSLIQAGGDIWYLNLNIAGPGTLDVTAGSTIYQGSKGSITSIGALATGDTRSGASISVTAGAGSAGLAYTDFAARYLDPDNLAVSGTPLADQPGKVAHTYEEELIEWLKEHYGHAATDAAEALAYFDALPLAQRAVFLREIYYAELKAAGREYNDASSTRYGSYLRGRKAIAALFPEGHAYSGDLVMFGGSGIRTLFGGDISVLTPGGKTIVGVEGMVPASTAGLVTQGTGDIGIYSKGSILLGLSRIMTTYGGNILAWSAEGDINAGRGAKTTVVYTPPKRVYDAYGNVTLSPVVPSNGAGIATLNPIPEIPPGDIDLIAPLGTVDAGEAGIRVSGNINIAALQVLNAANIQVQGNSTGVSIAPVAPNIAALTAASTAAGVATNAMNSVDTNRASATQEATPSVFQVQVIGYGMYDDSTTDAKKQLNNIIGPATATAEVIFAKQNP